MCTHAHTHTLGLLAFPVTPCSQIAGPRPQQGRREGAPGAHQSGKRRDALEKPVGCFCFNGNWGVTAHLVAQLQGNNPQHSQNRGARLSWETQRQGTSLLIPGDKERALSACVSGPLPRQTCTGTCIIHKAQSLSRSSSVSNSPPPGAAAILGSNKANPNIFPTPLHGLAPSAPRRPTSSLAQPVTHAGTSTTGWLPSHTRMPPA